MSLAKYNEDNFNLFYERMYLREQTDAERHTETKSAQNLTEDNSSAPHFVGQGYFLYNLKNERM